MTKDKTNPKVKGDNNGFKLNYKRTFTIGFAFFGILLLWQVYDSWAPTFLTELFKEALNTDNALEVQYLVGIMMALDNLAALLLLPLFGTLSDKTHTKIGKRMPYILIGTMLCSIAFPFIPVLFHYHNLAGTIGVMAVVIFFAMMYRNPAVALMPDITPKPLRSKANGIINIMGYLGGACATLVGIVFSLSKYLKGWADNSSSIWVIEAPFLIASVLMLISAVFLFFKIKENKIEEEMKSEMERGEKFSDVDIKCDDEHLSKKNKIILFLILGAEFFWFMADNGIGTFMVNYTVYYLQANSSAMMINTIVGGVGSVLGFLAGGWFASKIGRKRTIFAGLATTAIAIIIWIVVSYSIAVPTPEADSFNPFPIYLYFIWAIKGFAMSLVHVNSFPMVVELCTSKKIGKFTGFYYASSMAAQTVTPCLLGLILLIPNMSFQFLPVYGAGCLVISTIIFIFVKVKPNKNIKIKKGIEALDVDD